MNISNTGPRELYGQVRLDKPEPRVGNRQTQGSGAVHTDTVSVSDEAVLRTEAYRTAMSSSDIRQDKVNTIKDQIASGAYQVNSRRIASNLLRDESEMLD